MIIQLVLLINHEREGYLW